MRKLFFAFTQYHLLNCISLCENVFPKCEADIILFSPSNSGTTDVAKRANECGVFNRILVLENYHPCKQKLKKIYYITKEIITAIHHRNAIREFVQDYTYDEFYTYGSNMEAYIAYNEIGKKNHVKFSYYEEGAGTYVYSFYNELKPWYNIALKVMRVRIPTIPENIWIYKPDMLSIEIPDSVKVHELPLCKDRKLINTIWGVTEKQSIEERFTTIYFEQPGIDSHRQLELLSLFSTTTTVVKIHPRSAEKNYYKNYNLLADNRIPWEIYCVNDFSLENHVFVSSYSTACFTPKMLFNIEPVVIFTYYLYENKSNQENIILLMKNLIDSYEHKERIKVPKNEDELKKIIFDMHL